MAIKDWWFIKQRIVVSKSCASINGAFTVINGSFGKTAVPSGIAHISPVNLKPSCEISFFSGGSSLY